MKRLINSLTSHGRTSTDYQHKADSYCRRIKTIATIATVIGAGCIWFFVSHAAASLVELWGNVKSSLVNIK
jgi:hypothetical protein